MIQVSASHDGPWHEVSKETLQLAHKCPGINWWVRYDKGSPFLLADWQRFPNPPAPTRVMGYMSDNEQLTLCGMPVYWNDGERRWPMTVGNTRSRSDRN